MPTAFHYSARTCEILIVIEKSFGNLELEYWEMRGRRRAREGEGGKITLMSVYIKLFFYIPAHFGCTHRLYNLVQSIHVTIRTNTDMVIFMHCHFGWYFEYSNKTNCFVGQIGNTAQVKPLGTVKGGGHSPCP